MSSILEFFAVAAAISIEKAVLHLEMIEKHRIEQQLAHRQGGADGPAAGGRPRRGRATTSPAPTCRPGRSAATTSTTCRSRTAASAWRLPTCRARACPRRSSWRRSGRRSGPSGVDGRRRSTRRGPAQPHPARLDGRVPVRHGLLWPARARARGAFGFANCGHNPPLLLRAAGALRRCWPAAARRSACGTRRRSSRARRRSGQATSSCSTPTASSRS